MKEPTISDHALLSYMKRVKGIQIDSYKEEIKRILKLSWKGEESFKKDHYKYIMRNNRLITILSKKYVPEK